MTVFYDYPGLLYVVATLLPLASFVLLLLVGAVRSGLRSQRASGGVGQLFYQMLGGDNPGPTAAYVATGAIGLAFVFSLIGFVTYHHEAHELEHEIKHLKHELAEARHEWEHDQDNKDLKQKYDAKKKELEHEEARWAASIEWATVRPTGLKDPEHGTILRLGYYIDNLSVTMFLMVTFIATLIHLFSIGYMSDERAPEVADHQVHTDHGHLHRRGRFGRFFLFLSLFCFSMLNLILADNLFQVFVSWELVGVCSYLLIGFYYERTSASNAANKAFITNRVGDAGFIIGLLILWTYVGTLNFQDVFARIRSPEQGTIAHKTVDLAYAGQIVRAELIDEKFEDGYRKYLRVSKPEDAVGPDTQALLFPRVRDSHFYGAGPGGREKIPYRAQAAPEYYSSMPYWLLVVAGLGIFLGCVGKSAQFPLQVWLPDAMEGPTPVSALIHAATMVAAGVYLVGRCFPLFTAEALLVIAYTGAITLFVAATIAIVMTDIKKVLAYSTVSQLGYMMLGLGVGGWVAGLFHLITHAFFKALLFLGSGSVIYGCHHEQEMPKMGGLYPKMKITALTMLVGVLAIAGIPLFSGWYSKDAILAQALGFGLVHQQHFLLFLLPLLTAGITTFYMFRMWFLTFTGRPRDHHVHDHAHESPWVMTVPLILLAIFSVIVAWPLPSGPKPEEGLSGFHWPLLNAEASALEHWLHHSQPTSVMADFGQVPGHDEPTTIPFKDKRISERYQAHAYHDLAGMLALGVVGLGFVFASILYYWRVLDPAEAKEQFPGVHRFLSHKWYFDELYSALLVRPALAVAGWFKGFDLGVIDGFVHMLARIGVFFAWLHGLSDRYLVDGLVNVTARAMYATGNWLRNIQTGYIRSYVLFLVLAAVGIWILLTYFLGVPPAAVGGAP